MLVTAVLLAWSVSMPVAPGAESETEPTGTLAVGLARQGAIAVLRLAPSSRRVIRKRECPCKGASDRMPSWSRDGRRLAFVRGTLGSGRIWVMDADGGRARRLTSGSLDEDPAWSPDGHWIAYSSAYAGNRIKRVRPSGGAARAIPGTRGGQAPAWSPDGRRLAFRQRRRIVVARLDGSGRRTLGPGSEPSWAPDGRRITFVAGSGRRSFIGVMDADGSGRRRVTARGYVQSPAWSPDGEWVAFDGIRGDDPHSTYVLELDTGRVVRVAKNALEPSWRPTS